MITLTYEFETPGELSDHVKAYEEGAFAMSDLREVSAFVRNALKHRDDLSEEGRKLLEEVRELVRVDV